MAKAFGWLMLFALEIPSWILRGFVLAKMWLWFLVPLGVPEIGKAHAIGIAMLAALMLSGLARDKSEIEDALAAGFEALIKSVLASLLAWGIAAIVAGLM